MWEKVGLKKRCTTCGYELRFFDWITIKMVLHELMHEGANISRVTFYRLENKPEFPSVQRKKTISGWRVFTREEAEEVKNFIKDNFKLN